MEITAEGNIFVLDEGHDLESKLQKEFVCVTLADMARQAGSLEVSEESLRVQHVL